MLSQSLLTRSISAGANPNGGFKNLNTQGMDLGNSTTIPLNGDTGGTDHIWRGIWYPMGAEHLKLLSSLSSDVNGVLCVDFSEEEFPVDGDDSSVTECLSFNYDSIEDPLLRRQTPVQVRWIRHRYVNGPTAQQRFVISSIFTVSDPGLVMDRLSKLPNKKFLAGIVRSVQAISNTGNTEYVEMQGRDDGSSTNTITGIEKEFPLKALNSISVGQGSAVQTGAVPIPSAGTGLASRKTIEYSNHSELINVYWGTNGAVTTSTGKILRAGSDVSIDVTEDVDIYFIAQNTGGTTQFSDNDGTVSSGTCTNPNNIKFSDNNYAIFADGQNALLGSFAYALALASINQIRIGVEAKKDTSPVSQTVNHIETKVGTTANNTTVTSASLAGGVDLLCLVSITRDDINNVSSISGRGLNFEPAHVNLTDGGRSIDVWYAYGNPTSGTIEATMSSSTRAEISVSSFSGADPIVTIEATGTATGTGTVVTEGNIAKTNLGIGYTAVSHESASATPGAGYIERSDQTGGTGSNTVSLAVETKNFVVTGVEAATMSLSESSTWLAISVRVLPAQTIDTVYSIEYDVNGGGYLLAGELVFGDTEVVNYVDITGTHPLTQDSVNQTTIRITRTSSGLASGQVDNVFLEIVEGSTNSSARISYAEIADTEY
jgi:hypothetical protein